MFKKLIATVAAAGFLISVAPTTRAKSNMDFTLVNATGYQINEVYVGPHTSEDWGSDVLRDDVLHNGASTTITFPPAASYVESWDLKVTWADGSPAGYWFDLDLSAINKIILKYNRRTRQTSVDIEWSR